MSATILAENPAKFLSDVSAWMRQAAMDVARYEAHLVEQDIACRKREAEIGLEFANRLDDVVTALAATGSSMSIDDWCRTECGCDISTMRRRRRLHFRWSVYEAARRSLGDCGRTGLAFAMELIASKPFEAADRPAHLSDQEFDADLDAEEIDHGDGQTSGGDSWSTPQPLFDLLNEQFLFSLDVAASDQNAKCRKFFDKEIDGLTQEWPVSGAIWMNPPYSRLKLWAKKAFESAQSGATVVALIPAFTEAAWFHDYASRGKLIFLRGRVSHGSGSGYTPFSSMIAIWTPRLIRGRKLQVELDDGRLSKAARGVRVL